MIYKQTNINELFIEPNPNCSQLTWFVYSPITIALTKEKKNAAESKNYFYHCNYIKKCFTKEKNYIKKCFYCVCNIILLRIQLNHPIFFNYFLNWLLPPIFQFLLSTVPLVWPMAHSTTTKLSANLWFIFHNTKQTLIRLCVSAQWHYHKLKIHNILRTIHTKSLSHSHRLTIVYKVTITVPRERDRERDWYFMLCDLCQMGFSLFVGLPWAFFFF